MKVLTAMPEVTPPVGFVNVKRLEPGTPVASELEADRHLSAEERIHTDFDAIEVVAVARGASPW